MFNLLVSGHGEWWETPPFTSTIDRFNEYSGAEAEAIDLARPETLRRLEEIPALLMYEVGAGGPHARVVGTAACAISFGADTNWPSPSSPIRNMPFSTGQRGVENCGPAGHSTVRTAPYAPGDQGW
ncbi:hypothetical protein [Mesorhizobium sp. M0578]|uniref:hypothetical protein n=1 Tax=unclassified Mesorhizobium TaxID=325217 RepID=UPI00333A0A92